jgi:hypothetical protein
MLCRHALAPEGTEHGDASGRVRRRALFVYPSASRALMGGSIGELTALMRLYRALNRQEWHITFAECVRGADVVPRVERLVQSIASEPLCLATNPRDERTYTRNVSTQSMFRHHAVDLVVLSTVRAFFQYCKFPQTVSVVLRECREGAVPVVALDPCGDSFCAPLPEGIAALLPVPFSYQESLLSCQVSCALASRVSAASPGGGGWLWAASPWMGDFPQFVAVERVILKIAARLGLPMTLLSPVSERVGGDGMSTLTDALTYDEMERVIARFDVLLTANRRSVLAARAASAGVPVVWVNPANLREDATFDAVTNQLLRAARVEPAPLTPTPLEITEVRCTQWADAIDAMRRLVDTEPALRRAQSTRLHDYQEMESADAVLRVLASRFPTA